MVRPTFGCSNSKTNISTLNLLDVRHQQKNLKSMQKLKISLRISSVNQAHIC